MDKDFADLIRWLKSKGLEAHTRSGQALLVHRRVPKKVAHGKNKGLTR